MIQSLKKLIHSKLVADLEALEVRTLTVVGPAGTSTIGLEESSMTAIDMILGRGDANWIKITKDQSKAFKAAVKTGDALTVSLTSLRLFYDYVLAEDSLTLNPKDI